MSRHNFLDIEAEGRKKLALSADTTLTLKQLQDFGVFIGATDANTVALTLPTPHAAMAGMLRLIVNNGDNNMTVVDSGGFADAGDATDTITLVEGEMAMVFSDGTHWFALHHTTPG